MNIGILKCNRVKAQFAAVHGEYPEMFANLLLPLDSELSFTVYDAEQSQLPARVDACDAYLITGSSHGVNDALPWIGQLEQFIRQLHAAHKKVIGICFGHQLIAKALGGTVARSPQGWGVGMSNNKISKHKRWMDPPHEAFNLLISHQDQVMSLPKDAEILASNQSCPFYMLQIANNLTLQGHPEFSKSYVQALIESRKDILGIEQYEKGLASLQLNKDDALIAQWIMKFLRN